MLLLLPPSETKRAGGDEGTALDLSALSFPALTEPRATVLDATVRLSRNLQAATAALRLSMGRTDEILRNRALLTSPTMPALDRYDGVLYDALDAATLTLEQRAFAGRHVAIASAAFGLSAALDPIPAYRLSHDSRLPGVALGRLWRDPLAAVLEGIPGLILDLRSEAYAKLGPLPPRPDAVSVRVVSQDAAGRRRALNHFNKHGKGEFTRRVIEAGIVHDDVDALLDWARRSGIGLDPGAPGQLDLVV